jgi:dihydroorotase
LVDEGKIVALDADDQTAEVIAAEGCVVTPGWIDIAVELREPGYEEDETILTGTSAAVAGGFTTIASLPDTSPPVDSQGSVEYIHLQSVRAAQCNVLVLACVSKERLGEQLAELGLLVRAGAVGFTDAPASIDNADLMRRALQYCRMFGVPIFNRPETQELSEGGVMHDGLVSTVLGLPGMPPAAEDVMTGRDLRLAEATGGSLHLLSVSTQGSIEQIRRAKERGCDVTCSVSLPNLIETDEALRSFNTSLKLRPPLRAAHHVNACLEGLRDGTVDIITAGHAPRAAEKKMCELDVAPFGAMGLETAVPLIVTRLIEPGFLDWPTLIRRISLNPARLLRQSAKGSLVPGSDADVTVIDPNSTWRQPERGFRSKSSNSPWLNESLRGRVQAVVVRGTVVFNDHAEHLAHQGSHHVA